MLLLIGIGAFVVLGAAFALIFLLLGKGKDE